MNNAIPPEPHAFGQIGSGRGAMIKLRAQAAERRARLIRVGLTAGAR